MLCSNYSMHNCMRYRFVWAGMQTLIVFNSLLNGSAAALLYEQVGCQLFYAVSLFTAASNAGTRSCRTSQAFLQQQTLHASAGAERVAHPWNAVERGRLRSCGPKLRLPAGNGLLHARNSSSSSLLRLLQKAMLHRAQCEEVDAAMETVLDLVSAEQVEGCFAPACSNGSQAEGDLARMRSVAETYRSARCLYVQGARLVPATPHLHAAPGVSLRMQ